MGSPAVAQANAPVLNNFQYSPVDELLLPLDLLHTLTRGRVQVVSFLLFTEPLQLCKWNLPDCVQFNAYFHNLPDGSNP